MKKAKYATKILYILGIISSVLLLSLMPFMHFHEHHDCHSHDQCHEQDHEQEEGEPVQTNESCLGCVFLNSHVTFESPPITLVTNYLYIETLPLTEVSDFSFNPTTYIQSRAPPTYTYQPIDMLYIYQI